MSASGGGKNLSYMFSSFSGASVCSILSSSTDYEMLFCGIYEELQE